MARKIVCLTDPEYFILCRKVLELKPKEGLLIMLFMEAGLRVSEVQNLKIGTLYIAGRPVIEIIAKASHGKIGEPRGIAVSPNLTHALQVYWEWLKEENRPSGPVDPVFPGQNQGEVLTVRAMEKIVHKRTAQFIGRAVWPHALRHTFANRLMRVTSIRVVQELLGHKNLSTTQIYTHPNSNDCSTAINAAFK